MSLLHSPYQRYCLEAMGVTYWQRCMVSKVEFSIVSQPKEADKLVVLGQKAQWQLATPETKTMLKNLLQAILWVPKECAFAALVCEEAPREEGQGIALPLASWQHKGIRQVLVFDYDCAKALLGRRFDKPQRVDSKTPQTPINIVVLPALEALQQDAQRKRAAWGVLKTMRK